MSAYTSVSVIQRIKQKWTCVKKLKKNKPSGGKSSLIKKGTHTPFHRDEFTKRQIQRMKPHPRIFAENLKALSSSVNTTLKTVNNYAAVTINIKKGTKLEVTLKTQLD